MTDNLRDKMSDDLRTRLVRVFHDAETNSCATQNDWNLLADAVIRELGLERQDHYDPHCDYYRYVTDWIAPK